MKRVKNCKMQKKYKKNKEKFNFMVDIRVNLCYYYFDVRFVTFL